MKTIRLNVFLILSTLAGLANAQTKTLTLQDLSDFKSQAGNWQIVGDVTMNPDIDIHEKGKPELEAVEVKRGKKTKPIVAMQHNSL